jgi:hypothetical protein
MAVLYLVPVFGLLAGAFTGAFMAGGVNGTDSDHSIAFGLSGVCPGLCLLGCHFPNLVGGSADHAGHHPNRQHPVGFLV